MSPLVTIEVNGASRRATPSPAILPSCRLDSPSNSGRSASTTAHPYPSFWLLRVPLGPPRSLAWPPSLLRRHGRGNETSRCSRMLPPAVDEADRLVRPHAPARSAGSTSSRDLVEAQLRRSRIRQTSCVASVPSPGRGTASPIMIENRARGCPDAAASRESPIDVPPRSRRPKTMRCGSASIVCPNRAAPLGRERRSRPVAGRVQEASRLRVVHPSRPGGRIVDRSVARGRRGSPQSGSRMVMGVPQATAGEPGTVPGTRRTARGARQVVREPGTEPGSQPVVSSRGDDFRPRGLGTGQGTPPARPSAARPARRTRRCGRSPRRAAAAAGCPGRRPRCRARASATW